MQHKSNLSKKQSGLLGLILLISLIIFSQTAIAWDDCPFGYTDDPYPGVCPRYIDTNKDGLCDHSQSKPSLVQNDPIETTGDATKESEEYSAGIPWYENENLIIMLISLSMTLIGISITSYLKENDIIPAWKTRIIWNILLLVFFLPSSISGILLVTQTSFPLPQTLLLPILKIHTVSSFFFMWISGYHILLHPKYYSGCTRKLLTSNDKKSTGCQVTSPKEKTK